MQENIKKAYEDLQEIVDFLLDSNESVSTIKRLVYAVIDNHVAKSELDDFFISIVVE